MWKVAKLDETKFANKILHLSFDYHLTFSCEIPNSMLNLKLLRTFLLPNQMKDGSPFSKLISQKLISSFSCLRVLDLHDLGVQSLPSSVGKLLCLPSGLQHLKSLRSLNRSFNDEFLELPEWISCFSSLESMELTECPKLTSLPEGFRKLTALKQLNIIECSGLTEKCRGPNGRDWPKIQHIPLVSVRESHVD